MSLCPLQEHRIVNSTLRVVRRKGESAPFGNERRARRLIEQDVEGQGAHCMDVGIWVKEEVISLSRTLSRRFMRMRREKRVWREVLLQTEPLKTVVVDAPVREARVR